MPQSRRALAATADLTTTPPDTLPEYHRIARVTKAAGNHLYYIEYPQPAHVSSTHNTNTDDTAETIASAQITNTSGNTTTNANTALTELHPRFRNTIYLKRGSFVVVDTTALAERSNKLGGEIVNVVREERAWRKMKWWPREFGKAGGGEVGKGMPGDGDDEEGESVGDVGEGSNVDGEDG